MVGGLESWAEEPRLAVGIKKPVKGLMVGVGGTPLRERVGEVGGQTSEGPRRRPLPLWSESSGPEEDVVLGEEKEACLQTFPRNSPQD